MVWQKANKELIALLEEQMQNYRCDRRVMFGSPTFFIEGNMFAGVHENTIILRLSEGDLHEIFMRFEEIKPFAPMGGHVMKAYAALPLKIALQNGILDECLHKSYKFTSSLPIKIAKKSAKKKITD